MTSDLPVPDPLGRLHLQRWPFDVVPSEQSTEVWVGRPAALKQLRRLARGASRIPTSQIVIVWATFGSGKTHALRHLQHLTASDARLFCAYVVVPRGARSYLDLHRSVMQSVLSGSALTSVAHGLVQRGGLQSTDDTERALVRLAIGTDDERRVATAWLRAERVPVRELRAIGLQRRIETTGDAVIVLDRVIRTFAESGQRFMILFDEVQELEELGRRIGETVGGFHKLFDLNPDGLTLVFSFTTGSRATVRGILGDALFDRSGDVIALPALTKEEGSDFVRALLAHCSVGDAPSPTFPFTYDAIETVVASLDSTEPQLTPRVLMKQFSSLLQDVEMDIDLGEIEVADSDYVRTWLNERESGSSSV